MYLDSFFYGKTVIAPLGIVLYNLFGRGGPSLYGMCNISDQSGSTVKPPLADTFLGGTPNDGVSNFPTKTPHVNFL